MVQSVLQKLRQCDLNQPSSVAHGGFIQEIRNPATRSKAVNLLQMQNKHRSDWAWLIELCRRGFEILRGNDSLAAREVLERWISLGRKEGHGLFRRLALHACTEWEDKDVRTRGVELLLTGTVLWEMQYKREICRFLEITHQVLEPAQTQNIIAAIKQGPPRTMFRDDADFQQIADQMISLRMRLLSVEAVDERETFGGWMEVGRGNMAMIQIPDSPATGAVSESPETIADRLRSEYISPGNQLARLLRQDIEKGFKVMERLAEKGDDRELLWSWGLAGLDEALSPDPDPVLNRLVTFFGKHPECLSPASHGVANLLEDVSKRMQFPQEPPPFWSLWDKTWETCTSQDHTQEDHDLSWAINTAGYKIATALLIRLEKRTPPAAGLPGAFKKRFDAMVRGDSEAHLAARAKLMVHLCWLHAKDAAWVAEMLVPLLDCPKNEKNFVSLYWEAFTHSSVSVDILPIIKGYLRDTLERSTGDNILNKVGELFSDISIDYHNIFTKNEYESIFKSMNPIGLAACAKAYEHRLSNLGAKAADLWEQSIKPVIVNYWPVSRKKNTLETQNALADMAVYTREAFPDALKVLMTDKNLLGEVKHPGRIAMVLQERDSELVKRHPGEVLQFLDLIFPKSPDWNGYQQLTEVLQTIQSVKEILAEEPAFLRLAKIAGMNPSSL
ncbi:MAG: hypothetical protein HQL64_12700 [Magnetococcales bacterium]|nr:hypothetical protein [Magnetococcales bacterium]